MSKQELATTEGGVPQYILDMQAKGAVVNNTNFDSTDIVIPQIKLLQGMSEQVALFDHAKAGRFWHTGMDQLLGLNVKFVVCSARKKYLLQAPMDDGQGVLARSDDFINWDRTGEWKIKVDKKTTVTWKITDKNVIASGLTEWGSFDPEVTDEADKRPAATVFYEYLVLLPDHMSLGPCVISLARSAIKKAKKGLNDKIELHAQNGREMQAIQFQCATTTEQNSANQDFYNWSFTGAGFAPLDVYQKAKSIGNTLGNYRVQEEGIDDTAKSSKPVDEKGF